MWVSVFPSKSEAVPVATEWDIKQVEFATLTDFDPPSRPGAALFPDNPTNFYASGASIFQITAAANIVATFAATAAVIASLY
jgi:hypothetical protein